MFCPEIIFNNLKGPPKCEWTAWEPEGPCSTTCGGGIEPEQRCCRDKMSDNDCELPEDVEEGCPGEFKQQTPCSIGKITFEKWPLKNARLKMSVLKWLFQQC